MANDVDYIAQSKKFLYNTDEIFKAESKKSLLTNTDYDWTGAHSVKIWKMSTAQMNDYARRAQDDGTLSRYGELVDLATATEEMMLRKDRSFIFNIDALDPDESQGQMEAAKALARQLREVVIPEVDTYTYGIMVAGAGTKTQPAPLTKSNVYDKILDGSQELDDNEVPETERVLVVTPATYKLLKQATEFDHTEVGADMKLRGVVGYLDGMAVVKIPENRLPEGVGFMIAHPSATTAPVKLEDYNTHTNTPLSSGTIVTGRIVYDAFVLENKTKGIYVHMVSEATQE